MFNVWFTFVVNAYLSFVLSVCCNVGRRTSCLRTTADLVHRCRQVVVIMDLVTCWRTFVVGDQRGLTWSPSASRSRWRAVDVKNDLASCFALWPVTVWYDGPDRCTSQLHCTDLLLRLIKIQRVSSSLLSPVKGCKVTRTIRTSLIHKTINNNK